MSQNSSELMGMPVQRANEGQHDAKRGFLKSPLFHLLAAILVVALFQGFVAKLFVVPTGSMQPTIEIGERIVVDKTAYRYGAGKTPQPSDIVVFKKDVETWESSKGEVQDKSTVKYAIKFVLGDLLGIGPTTNELLVKRVIAVEGQVVRCCSSDSGAMVVDGEPLDEPYVFKDPTTVANKFDCGSDSYSSRCLPTVTVPEGKLLVLGDHRAISDDGATECRSDKEQQSVDCYRWVDRKDVVGKASFKIWPLSSWGPIH